MNKFRPSLYAPLIVFALLAAGFLFAVMQGGESGKFARHVGDPAPVTALPPLQSWKKGFSTQDWESRPYLVNFFASWCAPCRTEHDGLMWLAQAGVPVVGIAYKDPAQSTETFLGEVGDPFHTVAIDEDGRAGIDWGLTGVPETFLIDGYGIVRFHESGPLTDKIIQEKLMPLWRELSR